MQGYAREIVIHKTAESDSMCVSLVGESGQAYTFSVEPDDEDAEDDTFDAAVEMATRFENAVGLKWRVHDESKGFFLTNEDRL